MHNGNIQPIKTIIPVFRRGDIGAADQREEKEDFMIVTMVLDYFRF